VHFNIFPENIEECKKPYIITMHGNTNNTEETFNTNTVFVSKNHAERHGSDVFVHNGLDWAFYTKPDLNTKRSYYHFLAKAAWRVKNVKGAIACIKKTRSERLKVLGGVRFNFNMGVRLTFSTRVRFYGMVGGEKKDLLLNGSKGLIFPVRWNEPFGLAIIESLYYGCPVFGTPYGSLPEIVHDQVGFLSDQSELIAVQLENNQYNRHRCHEYASDVFNSKKMAISYLVLYEKVLSGQQLNRDFPKLKEKQQEKFLPWS
jgi:glycosyltransferase involved in cell wall biosynthesis